MKISKTVYFLTSMVIVLIIVNIFTLGFFIFNRNHNHPPFELREEGESGKYLTEELGFNSSQETLFEELRDNHHRTIEPMMKQISIEKERFFSKLKNEQIDSIKIDSLSKIISNIHQKVDIITFWHFNKVRRICNEKQKIRFDEIIKEGVVSPEKQRRLSHLME